MLGAKLFEKTAAAEERVQRIQGQVLTRCRFVSARRDFKLAELRAGQQADSVRIALVRLRPRFKGFRITENTL